VEEWHTRYIVGDERPPIDGSRDATRWLQQAFPVHQRPDMREATPDEVVKLDRLVDVHLGQKLLESERKKLDNEIREAIGDREGIQCPQATYTWRRTKDGKPKTDWESLAWALMTYHHVDKTTQDALLEQYSTVKPGIRRSYFKHDYLADDAEAAA
jgi:predicted phage-related endonuclease